MIHTNAITPRSKPTLIGFPFDLASSFLRGAAEAPAIIRQALHSPSASLWTETGFNLADADFFADAGDVPLPETNAAFEGIEAAIAQLLTQGRHPVSLGGDHSITYPILRAIAGKYPSLTILHFDAHPDLYDEFEGNRLSHACPFARIMEQRLASRLIQVGIRTLNQHQREQAARFGVEIIEMREFEKAAQLQFDTPVYLSFDVDGLDPAFAPGVSHHEPGGFSTRQALNIIHSINRPVIGADIVEFNPRRDLNNMTAMVCAKLLREIIGVMHLTS